MDTHTLSEALRALDANSLTWKFGLYSLSKSRDGLELEWNLCKMRGIVSRVDNARTALLKKAVDEKPVAPYSPFLSDKENIGAIDKTDELIREQISDVILNIQNGQTYEPEEFTSGTLPKTAGYAYYGERLGDDGQVCEQALFMRRGNPFLQGAIYTSSGDEIVACDKPVLKLATAVDFLMIGGVCYILSASIEKDFSLENRHFAIAGKRMEMIANTDIVNNYEKLEQAVMTAKNARKFADFNKDILEHITRLPIVDREEFLVTYGVTVDHTGRMDTSDAEQCELLIDLLCCRSCLDPLGRLSVGSGISPRE